MPAAPTFDDVWRMFQETSRRFEETDRRFQETDRKFQETERLMREQSKETERLMLEQSKETKDLVARVSRQLGAQGNRLGEFVQEMVRPAVVRLFQQRGLPVHQVVPNMLACDDNGQYVMEIDLTVINANVVVAVECKSHLSTEDVQEHLERLLIFKNTFRQFKDYTLYGAVAAMVIPADVGRYAYKRGLYVLAQSGDSMMLLNGEGFEPRTW